MKRISWLGILVVLGALGCKTGGDEVKDIVDVKVDEEGFKPSRVAAQVGRPLTLVFTRTAERTCADAVVIASEDIRQELPLNRPVRVSFIPSRSGNIHFACPMNMVTGEVVAHPPSR